MVFINRWWYFCLVFCFFLGINSFFAQQNNYKFIGVKTIKGDTIPSINLLIQNKWKATLYKNNKVIASYKECIPDTLPLLLNADKLQLSCIFTIDTQLTKEIYALEYLCFDNFKLKVNGHYTINENIHSEKFNFFENAAKSTLLISFPKKDNLIEVELHKKEIESINQMRLRLSTIKWNNQQKEKKTIQKNIALMKLIFFLSIGIVVFIQFFFYRIRKENFYFSAFCLLYVFSLLGDLVDFSEPTHILLFSIATLCLGALTNYLSIVLINKLHLRWPTLVFLIACAVCYIFYFSISDAFSWVILGLVLFYSIYHIFICLYLLFQGSIKKKWEAKYVTYGFFGALIFYIILFILHAFFNSSDYRGVVSVINYLYDFPIFILPLTLAIMIGKRNGMNQRELIDKYEEIKILSEENINREKEKQFILEEQNQVLENKVEVRTREIILQKHIVEEKQKEIIESINYAKRLQQAILPPIDLIRHYLPESFVLYRPKDIIAGDFYWLENVQDLTFIAAADCTGHGVPGALVSVVCSNALNRTVKEFGFIETGKILDKTRELVLETFEKSVNEVKDGMDISLLCIDRQNKRVFWSGANNPLWFINKVHAANENDNYQLTEIKADKQPIGKSDYGKPFSMHEIKYQDNTTFYLFTDGYADQFGGQKGKKFKYKPMQELLLSIQELPLIQQGGIINNAFNEWKDQLEQVDDVCVIGIRL